MADTANERPTKGERTRLRLVDVAATVFAEHGYAATTYDQLVQAAGLSRGAFYFHFPTKEQLAIEVLERTNQRWFTAITDRMGRQPDAATALRALAPALSELHSSDPSGWVASSLAKEADPDSELRRVAVAVTRMWIQYLQALIMAAQHQGGIRPELDAEAVARVLFASVDGLRDLSGLLEPPESQRATFGRQVELLTDLLYSGLFTTPAE